MKDFANSQQADKPLTFAEILRFYLPLATAAVIMIGSVNVVNSALSKTPNPQAALAAFAIAFSYAEMISAPCFSGMNMMITLGRDRKYFLNTFKFMIKVTAVAMCFIGVLAFTPVGKFVALNIGGASLDLYKDITTVWRFSLILPLVYLVLSTSRSVLLTEQKTIYVTIARGLRLVVMLTFAAFLPLLKGLSGAAIGVLIMLAGMGTEGLVALIPAVILFKKWHTEPKDVPEKNYPPTQAAVLKFITPLMVTSLMWGISRPLLYAGLARLNLGELSIATYKVANNFTWLFMVLVQDNVKHITVAFLRNNPNHKKNIVKFSAIASLAVTVLILISVFTPIGEYLLTNVIGVDKSMAVACTAPILVFAFYPILLTLEEHYQARLLLKGETKPIGFAKVLNIVAIGITVFTIAAIYPNMGAVTGSIALSVGMLVEALIVRHYAVKFRA